MRAGLCVPAIKAGYGDGAADCLQSANCRPAATALSNHS